MAENGLKSVSELETYFEGRVLGLARQAGRNYIVWQVSVIHLHKYCYCPSCMHACACCSKGVCVKPCRQSSSAKQSLSEAAVLLTVS